MISPWVPVDPLSDAAFAALRRRAIFDCNKWDPQVGDVCVVARHPLVVTRAAWQDVSSLASSLAREALQAERELVARPDLHRRLGLPRPVRRALRAAKSAGPTTGVARIIRFDFHHTPGGWRISEANADVPGGLNEASGFAALVGPHYPRAAPVGDPAQAYVDALAAAARPGAAVALVHATAYSDDQQMMAFIAERLAQAGLWPHLASPSHLRWRDGRAFLESQWWRGPVDLVLRFFPGDWLHALPRACGWRTWFAGGVTPVSNPPAALLVQSKRFPLVWDQLSTPLETWRALLPETRDPSHAPWRTSDDWVVKPALGRVGEGVGLREWVDAKDWRAIVRGARRHPRTWIAQRRFESTPLVIGGATLYPCLGVYTVGDRVVGAYGRFAPRPLIDSRAEDAAVLAA
jgi:glutathionylspermidine synthase